MLIDLMEDCWCLIHQAKCWEIMLHELDIVWNVPAHFWQTLGDVLGVFHVMWLHALSWHESCTTHVIYITVMMY